MMTMMTLRDLQPALHVPTSARSVTMAWPHFPVPDAEHTVRKSCKRPSFSLIGKSNRHPVVANQGLTMVIMFQRPDQYTTACSI